MTTPDETWFERAGARIVWLMAVLAGAGTVAAFLFRGWQWSAGFAAGAAISWLNFRWLQRLTEALGGSGGKPLRRGSAVFLGSRYLLLGAIAYVILRYSSVSLPAALAGLFVSVGAVIVEILFELIYGRNLDH
jgi:ATP synthase I chain